MARDGPSVILLLKNETHITKSCLRSLPKEKESSHINGCYGVVPRACLNIQFKARPALLGLQSLCHGLGWCCTHLKAEFWHSEKHGVTCVPQSFLRCGKPSLVQSLSGTYMSLCFMKEAQRMNFTPFLTCNALKVSSGQFALWSVFCNKACKKCGTLILGCGQILPSLSDFQQSVRGVILFCRAGLGPTPAALQASISQGCQGSQDWVKNVKDESVLFNV